MIATTFDNEILKDVEWFIKRHSSENFYDGYFIRFENTRVNIVRIMYTKKLYDSKSQVKNYCILSYSISEKGFFNRFEKARQHWYNVGEDHYFHTIYDTYDEALEQVKKNYKIRLEQVLREHDNAYSHLIDIENIAR